MSSDDGSSADKTSAGESSERELRFRKMVRSDLDSVLKIEVECFDKPWTRKTFWQWLSTPEVRGELLLCGDRLVGFILWTIEPGQLHVLNVAVRKSEWRQGYGSSLVERAHRAAVDAGLTKIMLEVTETNLSAQLLYRSLGYRMIKILREPDADRDRYRMEREIDFTSA